MRRYMGARLIEGNVNERKDLRPVNSPATQAGMRGVHRGTDGSVIGGYTAEGQAMGTKAGQPAYRSKLAERNQIGVKPSSLGGGLARWQAMNPDAKLATEKRGSEIGYSASDGPETRAATGELLKKRRSLYERMKLAGSGGLSPAMRQEAENLGVTEKGWRRASNSLSIAPAMLSNQPAGVASSSDSGMASNKWVAPHLPIKGTEKQVDGPETPQAAPPAPERPKKSITLDSQLSSIRDRITASERALAKPKALASGATTQPAATPTKKRSWSMTGNRYTTAAQRSPVGQQGVAQKKSTPTPAPASSPTPAKKSLASKYNVSFPGNVPSRGTAAQKQREAQERLRKRQQAANPTNFTDNNQSWRGTAFGSIMDWLAQPRI